MSNPPVRVERRVGQRFPFLLPVSFRELGSGLEGIGITQDLSSRGACFLTDVPLVEGREIELTLNMPAEITLGESMRVRCRGPVLRIVRPSAASTEDSGQTSNVAVSVRLECYEYLSGSAESSADFVRVSSLHPQDEVEKRWASIDRS